ncbi:MAG: hypothetical protein J3K34DRAFT_432131 [Monoraphidium minutum]|nr:MAG: hypothetical protein J3K34DRAFT_432131 [Monoraphidium minutum]
MPQQGGGGGGFLSGMMGAVAQGAALGTGSAIAHRAMDSVMGPRTVVHEHQGAPPAAAPMEAAAPAGAAQEGPCAAQAKAFAECIQRSGGDMGACQPYLDVMQQCKFNNPNWA